MKNSNISQRVRKGGLALIVCLAFGSALVQAQSEVGKSNPTKTDTLSTEVARLLLEVQELVQAKKFNEALNKLRQVDAVANKTPYENFVTDRLRGSAAAGAGDIELTVQSFESVINSGRLPLAEKLTTIEAIVGTYSQAKDYVRLIPWARRYVDEGGGNDQVRVVLTQAQYLSGDYEAAIRVLRAEFGADDKAGRISSEDKLQLLASCYAKLKNFAAYTEVLEKIATYYSKKEYWADLVARIQRKPGFSERLALDGYRLQQATGNLTQADDFVDMTELALAVKLPSEAERIVDEGFSKSILGLGKDAAKHIRLRDLVKRSAANDRKVLPKDEAEAATSKNGIGLVDVGFAYVSGGEFDKGIALVQRGIAKGGLKHPEDAKLHLALAYLRSGNKALAMSTLKTVQGSDGAADLARLWSIFLR